MLSLLLAPRAARAAVGFLVAAPWPCTRAPKNEKDGAGNRPVGFGVRERTRA